MKRYLLDTNHFSAFWRGDARLLERLQQLEDAELGLSTPGLGEQWYMVFNSAQLARNYARMELIVQQFVIWPFDDHAAQEHGRIRAELRRRGRPIPVVDMQIAAIARANQLTVLTSDTHFSLVDGVEVEDWLTPSSTQI